jgi:hypothetical protein
VVTRTGAARGFRKLNDVNRNSSFASGDETVSHLLYLYLWPFWMFKDASKGSLLERAAAYRHNREKRIYLPGYIAKWSTIFVLLLGAAVVLEGTEKAYSPGTTSCSMLACGAGLLATWAFVVMLIISVVYVFLTHWER